MTSIKHNNRELPNRTNDRSKEDNNYIFKKDIQEVYRSIFSEAVAEYNENQKRNDRKIKDYYDHVYRNKKQKEQQELIVQVGNMFDAENEKSREDFEEILVDYVENWSVRNPNLVLYNAALHQDEDGGPHLHLNFVPFADYEKGLKRRVNFEKALFQQGYSDFGQWRESETGTIEQLMNERGYKREYVGTHDYVKAEIYTRIAREVGQNYEKELASLKKENCELKNENKKITQIYEDDREAVNQSFTEMVLTNESLEKENKALKLQVEKLQDENNKLHRAADEIYEWLLDKHYQTLDDFIRYSTEKNNHWVQIDETKKGKRIIAEFQRGQQNQEDPGHER